MPICTQGFSVRLLSSHRSIATLALPTGLLSSTLAASTSSTISLIQADFAFIGEDMGRRSRRERDPRRRRKRRQPR